jgi:glycosyltransferase involved in cell wall biosynthesis
MKNPLVSIITISFNSERFIEQTIKSVLDQDYPAIEYIIIDGSSTDNTLEIIDKYKDRVSKVISESDQGISDAMNKGIQLSSGEIIGIIHSDDYYADGTVIGKVVEAFGASEQVEVVYGIQDVVDPDTGETKVHWGREAEPSEIRKRMYMPHPTVFCKKEIYDRTGLFRKDYKLAMDYEWAIRVTKHTRPRFVNYKLACMRDMGASGKNYKIALGESARALREHGYYLDYLFMMARNCIKMLLIKLGMKSLLYELWERNVRPEGQSYGNRSTK